jgi:hypothetical protein
MDSWLYLARAWGLFSVLISAALLLNRRRLVSQIKAFSDEYPIILIAGVIALGIGALQVTGRNSWTLDYRGLITLFGWLSLLKGIGITFVPTRYLALSARLLGMGSWYTFALASLLLIGMCLLYVGITG